MFEAPHADFSRRHSAQGGLSQVPAAMRRLADELGVAFRTGEAFRATRIRRAGGDDPTRERRERWRLEKRD